MKNSPKVTLLFCTVAPLLWAAGTIWASAQEQAISCDKVPAAVRTAFQTAYPKATIRDCAKEVEKDKVVYEISSIEGKTSRDILYYENGTLIVVEEVIPTGDLPEAVRQAISKRSPGPIALAEKLTRDSTITYEVRLDRQGKVLELVFDPDGKEMAP